MPNHLTAIEEAFLDLCDGNYTHWKDIQRDTGLTEERCKEILALYYDLCKKNDLLSCL